MDSSRSSRARTASGGFAAHITGNHTLDRDFTELSASDLQTGELQFGLPAALMVLLLVVGTLVGAAIPMMMAILSIVVALGVTAVIGQVFELNLFIVNMIVAMGLALGIDYSLFIVSRLREERHRGRDTREAILVVASTATRAVVFSGIAFTLAMIAMLLVPDTTLRSLGLGAVIVGLVSIAVALTFHPAVLMVLGDRVDRLALPWLGRRIAASAGEEGRVWRRAVGGVMRRPGISLIAGTAVLLALASSVVDLRMGQAGTSALPDDTVSKQGLIALERDFPRGATDPVNIVVDGSPGDPRTVPRPDPPARPPGHRPRLRRPHRDHRVGAARRRGLGAADGRAQQRASVRGHRPPARRLRAARVRRDRRTACMSAARRPRRATPSPSTAAGCRS